MKSLDYYRAILYLFGICYSLCQVGVVIVIGMGVLSGIYVFLSPVENAEALDSKSNFEVVDRYQDRCDVVRYTDDSMATYKYFLDCDNKTK